MVEITTTFSDEAIALMKEFAAKKNLSLAEYCKQAILDRLEDDEDIRDADAAYAEYLKNPVTISHKQLWQELEAV